MVVRKVYEWAPYVVSKFESNWHNYWGTREVYYCLHLSSYKLLLSLLCFNNWISPVVPYCYPVLELELVICERLGLSLLNIIPLSDTIPSNLLHQQKMDLAWNMSHKYCYIKQFPLSASCVPFRHATLWPCFGTLLSWGQQHHINEYSSIPLQFRWHPTVTSDGERNFFTHQEPVSLRAGIPGSWGDCKLLISEYRVVEPRILHE